MKEKLEYILEKINEQLHELTPLAHINADKLFCEALLLFIIEYPIMKDITESFECLRKWYE